MWWKWTRAPGNSYTLLKKIKKWKNKRNSDWRKRENYNAANFFYVDKTEWVFWRWNVFLEALWNSTSSHLAVTQENRQEQLSSYLLLSCFLFFVIYLISYLLYLFFFNIYHILFPRLTSSTTRKWDLIC